MTSLFIVWLSLASAPATARPAIVFDLDHTLVDTNQRIIVLLRELGVEHEIPELLAVTTEQVEALRRRRIDALGLRKRGTIAKLFGARDDDSVESSPFGRRFYFDASYLRHDGLIPGAPDFVARLARATDADVFYLTGRFEDEFREATIAQLTHWGFPGFGSEHPIPGAAHLILKPNKFPRSTDQFKVSEFVEIAHDRSIVAVFDDSKRNVNAFAKFLAAETPIVRITRDVGDRRGLPARVEQITNYVYNTVTTDGGRSTAVINGAQLEAIVTRAKTCAAALTAAPSAAVRELFSSDPVG